MWSHQAAGIMVMPLLSVGGLSLRRHPAAQRRWWPHHDTDLHPACNAQFVRLNCTTLHSVSRRRAATLLHRRSNSEGAAQSNWLRSIMLRCMRVGTRAACVATALSVSAHAQSYIYCRVTGELGDLQHLWPHHRADRLAAGQGGTAEHSMVITSMPCSGRTGRRAAPVATPPCKPTPSWPSRHY